MMGLLQTLELLIGRRGKKLKKGRETRPNNHTQIQNVQDDPPAS
jgi:hypothetical protein